MRSLLLPVYCLITVLTAGQAMVWSSWSAGVGGLAASALALFGPATLLYVPAGREKDHRATELALFGAVAVGFLALAFALVLWSEFSLSVAGLRIPGPYWVVAGMLTAVAATR